MQPHEYEWVRQTRKTVLDFCGEMEPRDFTRHPEGFNWSMRDALVHIADCYIAWLGSFVLSRTDKPLTPKEVVQRFGIDEIKVRFELADAFVNEVFAGHVHPMDEEIGRKIPWREKEELLTITPGKLLVHTVTHEFHHKGQMMSMARQMGYVPPYTDVLGTDE